MLRKSFFLKAVSATAFLLGIASISPAFKGPVYTMADGVVRSSHLKGAKEAYLPIVRASSHASNLLALPNGDLFCFYFSGTQEGESGVSIVMSKLEHDSNRWTKPELLSYRKGWSNQNPVPFQGPDGRLWLFHTSRKARQGQTTAIVFYLTSNDEGHTWTAAKPLFTEPGSFDRQHLVIFHNEWLFPMYHSASFGITRNAQGDFSFVKTTRDNGNTWSACKVPGSNGLVQMDIIKLSETNLLSFFRSRYADWIYKSFSRDGCHWSVPVATQLPNNNSSIQAARLRDGHLVIAFNNAHATDVRGMPRTASRTILSVALSADGGKTWPWVRDVQPGLTPPAFFPSEDPEYSYPSIVQTANGMIQLTFTFRRETIKYMTFREQWIKHGRSVGLFKGDSQ